MIRHAQAAARLRSVHLTRRALPACQVCIANQRRLLSSDGGDKKKPQGMFDGLKTQFDEAVSKNPELKEQVMCSHLQCCATSDAAP